MRGMKPIHLALARFVRGLALVALAPATRAQRSRRPVREEPGGKWSRAPSATTTSS